jgi:hypothetical protein
MGDRPPARAHTRGAPLSVQNSSTERIELPELRQLARDGCEPIYLLEQAFRTVFDQSPRLSHRKWGQTLLRAARRGDRYAEAGRQQTGAAVGWVIDRMLEDQAEGRRPHSLAFYVQRLDFESRDWRRYAKVERRVLQPAELAA